MYLTKVNDGGNHQATGVLPTPNYNPTHRPSAAVQAWGVPWSSRIHLVELVQVVGAIVGQQLVLVAINC